MGGGSWNAQSWTNYASANVVGKTQAQVLSSTYLKEDYDPTKIVSRLRESRDGPDNPITTPIIIATDVTGSMGSLAERLMRGGINTVCTELYDRKPVTGPQIMTMALGDAYTDRAPIQVTQFESDIRIAEQTKDLYLEGNGGGNGGESYGLAWLFAAMMTSTDSFEKRGHKGYLFTVGDEPIHGVAGGSGNEYAVTVDQAKRFFDLDIEKDLTAQEVLAMVSETYEVFHVVVNRERGSYHATDIASTWGQIMPERLLWLDSVDNLSETIVSTIQVFEGASKAAVAASWNGNTAVAVASALRDLVPRKGGTVNEMVRTA